MYLRLVAVGLMMLLLSGCWGNRNIDQIVYIHSIGIDYDNRQLVLYVQLINFSGLAKTEYGGGRQVSTVAIGRSTGETPETAAHELYTSIQQMVSWGHVKSIVFTKRALKKEVVQGVVDLLTRYHEIRHTIWVYATDAPLGDLFKATPLLRASSYFSMLTNPEELFKQSSFIRPLRFNRLIAISDEHSSTLRIPYITLDPASWTENMKKKKMPSLSGVCFLHDYELKQCADRGELLGVRWTERDVIRTPIYVKEGRQTVASLVVRHPKAKWSVLSTKDGPAFQLTIQAQGSLIELRKPLSRVRLAKLAAQTVKQEIQQAYEWGIKRNIDTLNVSDQLYRHNVQQWKQWEQNGLIPLKKNTIRNISVHLSINSSGKEKLDYRAGD
ncbi:Ger(x)C family spore germination protein [Geobacillus sp. BMUD]|uniref:Ger(x)C family spore germination protein n=1 Tax=Geobacillus TaxID=129337 RepID=UPI0004DF2437|nr:MULTISPECIES: Ger(x)C family spore germination protein [Geobacillus]NNU84568.1 Ger(x)C family spore germination protein [Geobacillus sp. BMUD]